jgi:hypothetical protein
MCRAAPKRKENLIHEEQRKYKNLILFVFVTVVVPLGIVLPSL